MVKVSILMSVYNEKEKDLRQSIESVLNQDFQDFEFIIVNDNPNNDIIKDILRQYSEIDKRIKLILNEENIGLAMSLNRAAKIANSEYLLRMDADDICEPNRISIQYNFIRSHEYDVVCSNYSFINEHSLPINREVRHYTPSEIVKKLPQGNVIHHPTVIMKKEAFDIVGGYRDFPCSQDYDLWLRMLEKNFSFYMINKKLLRYRVRSESISVSRRYEQLCTSIYIRNLYLERLKTGKDNYTFSNYKKYLSNLARYTEKEKVNNYYNMLVKSHENYNNKKYISGLYIRMKVFLNSKIYRENFKSKMILKLYLLTKMKIKDNQKEVKK